MPLTVQLTFPAGRYHATPWGRHVNEGVAEWPPSPWRLLRALVAVWKRTCSELPERCVRRALEQLSQPPRFHLPSYRLAHTRHYLPWEKKGPLDRTLVFDSFVSIDRHTPVYMDWADGALVLEEYQTLKTLLRNLSSLGRAESWVQAELVDAVKNWNCLPAMGDELNPVPIFCPDPATAFSDEYYPTLDPKKLAKAKVNPLRFLFDCPRWNLCLDTETIHAKRWPTVPGSRWLTYTRPIEHSVRPASRKSVDQPKPTIARFLLDGPVLPLATDTVRVAESFRRAAMGRFARWCLRCPDEGESFRRADTSDAYSSPILSGKELNSEIRQDHRHAYYLPTVEGIDPRRITHMTVTAEDGFGRGEIAAFTALRDLILGQGSMKLRVQLVGLGQRANFSTSLLRKSTVWESVTPFVAHRHLKQRGPKRDLLDPDLDDWRFAFLQLTARELIEQHYGTSPMAIEPAKGNSGSLRAIDFRRYRENRRPESQGRWFGFLRIQFAKPLTGPLTIGYGSHFGLGLFAAAEG
jgi:CRISPR-associated protein Csb2